MNPWSLLIVISVQLVLAASAYAQSNSAKQIDHRAERLLLTAKLSFEIDDDGDFRLELPIGNDRTQFVWVISQTSKLGDLEIREIWSIGYRSAEPFSQEVGNRLLQANSKVKLGAWQMRRLGEDHVAVFSAQIAAQTDVQTLLLSIHAVSSTADEMEIELTDGKDRF